MRFHSFLIFTLLVCFCLGNKGLAQVSGVAQPKARITRDIDNSSRISLRGNVYPLVKQAPDSYPADLSAPMEHMVLQLVADGQQEAQLDQLIAAQSNPKSALYHRYLTPKAFGQKFGAADADIVKITNWLESQGFQIEQIPAGKRLVVFSGTADQVLKAFNTEIREFHIGGAVHLANITDPQVPSALAGVVGGIVKLNDFRHTAIPKILKGEIGQPGNSQYTNSTGSHYLSPADYSTIYNINPLYSAGINGSGASIAILARSDVSLSDLQNFRSTFGLPASNPQFLVTNTDPGTVSGDALETTLDTEWAGAVAPNASIKVIISSSSNSADGIDLSALYAVNQNIAPIISLSYGQCEAWMGTTEMSFYNSLWKQAAAQGQTVLVSAGDAGAAGCNNGSDKSAIYGAAVNGLCSSPYATCVGGTEFAEGGNAGPYWQSGNSSVFGSALSYIPETVWNESGNSGGSGLWSSGGGASIAYAKPSWQTGPGVPADGKRDVPDVALTAAGHDGYVIAFQGALYSVSGTSAAAPSFAGLVALIDQETAAAQGLINSTLYPLAIAQAQGGPKVFHDTTTGNNSVPGQAGFAAGVGYDLSSGLGSVDASVMVNSWTNGATPTLAINASNGSLNLILGQSGQLVINSVASNLNSAVSLTASGMPAGMTAAFTPATIASPGSGTANLKITASNTLKPGTYTLMITGTAGSQSATTTLTIVVPTPSFTLSTSLSSLTVAQGGSGSVGITISAVNGFNSSTSLVITGMPAGVIALFSPTTVAGGGSTVLNLAVTANAAIGNYALAIKAMSGSITQTAAFSLKITGPATCTLISSPANISVNAGSTASLQVSCLNPSSTFTTPLAVSVSGAPVGMTAQIVTPSFPAGSGTLINLATATALTSGTYNLVFKAMSGSFGQSIAIPVTVRSNPAFTLTASQTSLKVTAGSSVQTTLNVNPTNGFNSAVNWAATAPSGISVSFSTLSLPAPGKGSVTATIMVGSKVAAGTYNVSVTANGQQISQTAIIAVTVLANPSFSLTVNAATISLTQGGSANITVSTGNYSGGFKGQLTVAMTGLPAGMSYAYASANTGNNVVNVIYKITSSTSVKLGTYPITVTASGQSVTHSQVVTVTVTAASAQTKH